MTHDSIRVHCRFDFIMWDHGYVGWPLIEYLLVQSKTLFYVVHISSMPKAQIEGLIFQDEKHEYYLIYRSYIIRTQF